MGCLVAFVYGAATCSLLLVALLCPAGLLANIGVPKGIDDGPATTTVAALLIDLRVYLGDDYQGYRPRVCSTLDAG